MASAHGHFGWPTRGIRIGRLESRVELANGRRLEWVDLAGKRAHKINHTNERQTEARDKNDDEQARVIQRLGSRRGAS